MLAKNLRNNSDWFLVFYQQDEDRQEQIRAQILGSQVPKARVHEFFDSYTTDDRMMVSRIKVIREDKTRVVTGVKMKLYWYKVKVLDRGHWRMTSPIMYDYAEMHQLPHAGRPRINWNNFRSDQAFANLAAPGQQTTLKILDEDGRVIEEPQSVFDQL